MESARDVERARAHQTPPGPEAELAAVLESIEAGVLVVAPDGRVVSQNRAAERVIESRLEHVTEILGPLGWVSWDEGRSPGRAR